MALVTTLGLSHPRVASEEDLRALLQTKNKVLGHDDAAGTVQILAGVTNIVDHVGDVVEPGAYSRTLKERNPKGCKSHDHKTPLAKAIKTEEWLPGDPRLPRKYHELGAGALYVELQYNLDKGDDGAYVAPTSAEEFHMVKFMGDDGEWSIGYDCSGKKGKAIKNPKTGYRHIKDLTLYEVSSVLAGAAPHTGTISAKQDDWAVTETKGLFESYVIEDGEAKARGYGSDKETPAEDGPGDEQEPPKKKKAKADEENSAEDISGDEQEEPPKKTKAEFYGEEKIGRSRGQYNADARDADNDRIVQEGTPFARPAGPRLGGGHVVASQGRDKPHDPSTIPWHVQADIHGNYWAVGDRGEVNLHTTDVAQAQDNLHLLRTRELVQFRIPGGLAQHQVVPTDRGGTRITSVSPWTSDIAKQHLEAQGVPVRRISPTEIEMAPGVRVATDTPPPKPTPLGTLEDMRAYAYEHGIEGPGFSQGTDKPYDPVDPRDDWNSPDFVPFDRRGTLPDATNDDLLKMGQDAIKSGDREALRKAREELYGRTRLYIDPEDPNRWEKDSFREHAYEAHAHLMDAMDSAGLGLNYSQGSDTPYDPAGGGQELDPITGRSVPWKDAFDRLDESGIENALDKYYEWLDQAVADGNHADIDRLQTRVEYLEALLGNTGGPNAKALPMSAEEVMVAASDAVDAYLAAEFAEEGVVGWVEDVYGDRLAMGVASYGSDGTPAVEMWDVDLEWNDGVPTLGEPELVPLGHIGVAKGDDLECLSAAEIVAAAISFKMALRRRQNLTYLEGDARIEAKERYTLGADLEVKDVYAASPTGDIETGFSPIERMRKRKRRADRNMGVDVVGTEMMKAAAEVLGEIQNAVTEDMERKVGRVLSRVNLDRIQAALGTLNELVAIVEPAEDEAIEVVDIGNDAAAFKALLAEKSNTTDSRGHDVRADGNNLNSNRRARQNAGAAGRMGANAAVAGVGAGVAQPSRQGAPQVDHDHDGIIGDGTPNARRATTSSAGTPAKSDDELRSEIANDPSLGGRRHSRAFVEEELKRRKAQQGKDDLDGMEVKRTRSHVRRLLDAAVDADHDGKIYDGTPQERPAPIRSREGRGAGLHGDQMKTPGGGVPGGAAHARPISSTDSRTATLNNPHPNRPAETKPQGGKVHAFIESITHHDRDAAAKAEAEQFHASLLKEQENRHGGAPPKPEEMTRLTQVVDAYETHLGSLDATSTRQYLSARDFLRDLQRDAEWWQNERPNGPGTDEGSASKKRFEDTVVKGAKWDALQIEVKEMGDDELALLIDFLDLELAPESKRQFTSAQRSAAADSGAAMPDGSFPIKNRSDLANAVQAYGRAKDKAAAKAHIIKRARALNAMSALPDGWA